ncbi:MAG: LysM peptidoglycan-binding domain-containing protein [Bacteroidaceae bacterium]|nr:LysM peptidoglycan-binding domain-containing protein [Bacteroidaceae bacterium]
MKRILILFYCLCPMVLFGQGILSTLDNMHSVVKGETWESVASSYGVSIMELQAANPDVKSNKLKKGTLLIIPKKPKQMDFVPVSEVPEKPLRVIRTVISDLKVGVMLPLSDKKMVEFYRGLLMAADSVRKSGVNLDIHAWDCGSTTAQVEALLPQLSELDVLFGPAQATQIQPVAEACKERGIRLVLPFYSGQVLQDYPLVYNATAPNSIHYEAAVKKLLSYYPDKNYVIAHSGNPDNKGRALTESLAAALAQRTGTPRTFELAGDDFAYESAFNQFRDNVIVLDNSSTASVNTLLSHLKEFRQKHSQYRISLLGYPEWQDEQDALLDNFFAFDTYIISPYYYNALDNKVKRFERTYAKNFRAYIIKENPRYAALGYDLGCYFLGGLSSLGDTFEQMQGSIRQEPYQNWFRFERNASGLSFSNSFVQFIHFTPDNKIELIR